MACGNECVREAKTPVTPSPVATGCIDIVLPDGSVLDNIVNGVGIVSGSDSIQVTWDEANQQYVVSQESPYINLTGADTKWEDLVNQLEFNTVTAITLAYRSLTSMLSDRNITPRTNATYYGAAFKWNAAGGPRVFMKVHGINGSGSDATEYNAFSSPGVFDPAYHTVWVTHTEPTVDASPVD